MRNYDKEARDHPDHKYAYSIDYEFHKFMMRTFMLMGAKGNALELGCYHGAFTKLIANEFDHLTVIEASEECVAIASRAVGPNVKFINSTFENAKPDQKFDAIFFIHTLEHLDHQVKVLNRVKNWLSDEGKLFLVTPNANAPSRQIAVKMGLIEHNSAITAAEMEHGHTITYSLDTLERDAKSAGYQIFHRGGIFFKGLANFQLDKALEAGIIDQKYLEGCYQLGMVYPDLCSSIYVICTH